MAALLRQGARRIGGSVLQRTQAGVSSPAVAEEGRRLVPRRMTSDSRAIEEDVQQKKEALYEALSRVYNSRNRGLLQDLSRHVEPKPHDSEWRLFRRARKINSFAEAAGTVMLYSFVVVVNDMYGTHAKTAETLMEKERENQAETLMEKQV